MSATEQMHHLVVMIESGSIRANLLCPYEGQAISEANAPDCRRYNDTAEFPRLADMCLAGAAWDEELEDCIEVDGPPIEVTDYPIPVTYRWDGDEFYVTPAAVPTPGQEG